MFPASYDKKKLDFSLLGNHSRRKLLYYLFTYSPSVNINAFKKWVQVWGREVAALKNQTMKNGKLKMTMTSHVHSRG